MTISHLWKIAVKIGHRYNRYVGVFYTRNDVMTKKLEEYTREELIEVVKSLKRRKKFGLVWEDKPEAVVDQCLTELPVLEEVLERNISSAPDSATNFIIEGDNYHSLSTLNYTHAGKIDFIYIDPPYNTGNKDFVYNDSYVDKEDTFRHSKWLSFMSQRLRLAKSLLTENGVIFISIDDNEYVNLKLLCDAIFSESNSIGPFIQNKLNAKNDTLNVQKNHEYILVYRNSEIKANGKTVPTLINKKPATKEVLQDNDGFFYLSDPITTRGDGGTLNKRKNLGYTIYFHPDTGDFKGVMDYNLDLAKTSNNEQEVYQTDESLIADGYVGIRPPKVRGKLGAWTWDCERFNSRLAEIYIKPTRTGYTVNKKIFVEPELVYEIDGKHYYDNLSKNGNSKSILEYSTNEGTDRLNQILEAGSFNNPKNVDMLKFFISIYDKKDALVLDFFAGSGTTAQAVLEINEEDGGSRNFILCTNNENDIAENITYVRIKKVIEGYGTTEALPANVRYFKTAFVSRKQTDDQTRIELVARSSEMICLREDAFDKISDTDDFKIYEGVAGYAAIVFNPEAIDTLKSELDALTTDKPASIYVFSLSNDTYESDFADLERAHQLRAIPESILEVYRRIFSEQTERLGE